MWTYRLILSLIGVMVFFSLVTATEERGVKARYQEAREMYYTLKTSPDLQKQRVQWLKCIRAFQLLWKDYPHSPEGQRALFLIGRLASDLAKLSQKPEDRQMAVQAYQYFVQQYPTSRLADDAQFQLGEIARAYGDLIQAKKAYQTVIQHFPSGDMVQKATSRLEEVTNGGPKPPDSTQAKSKLQTSPGTHEPPQLIQTIRHWSNSRYTRVVVDVDGVVNFQESRLTNPERLYLDFSPARIKPAQSPASVEIANGQLKRIRAAQYQPEVVRVVLDLEEIAHYKIFTLEDPFRVVIDVFGQKKELAGSALSSTAGFAARKEQGLSTPLSLVQQLGLGIGKVVIDPGHGGKDPGGIGPTGLKEKDIVLDIAWKLRKLIERELGWKVVMTREKDVFIPLEERTAIANSQEADLFISIHTNASPREEGKGVETYFLDLATSPEAMETAARENMTSVRRISDLQILLKDILFNTKRNESSRMAHVVQTAMITHLSKHYSNVENRGVKQAPFFVLLGAEMPSILVEVSFISNPDEEKQLKRDAYRLTLARGILEGLKDYADKTKSLVSWQSQKPGN